MNVNAREIAAIQYEIQEVQLKKQNYEQKVQKAKDELDILNARLRHLQMIQRKGDQDRDDEHGKKDGGHGRGKKDDVKLYGRGYNGAF